MGHCSFLYVGLFLDSYEERVEGSWIWKDLWPVRNSRPSFSSPLGLLGGVFYTGATQLLLRGREPWTLKHHGADHAHLREANRCSPRDYPKPDGKISFDLLTSVALTGGVTNRTCSVLWDYQFVLLWCRYEPRPRSAASPHSGR